MANSSTIIDHGSLTNLPHPNYDHPLYLARGDATITGDITVSSGVTIGGVDFDPDVMLWGLI